LIKREKVLGLPWIPAQLLPGPHQTGEFVPNRNELEPFWKDLIREIAAGSKLKEDE
jgi:hypothetical protein